MIAFERNNFYPIKNIIGTFDLIKKFDFDIKTFKISDDFTLNDISSLNNLRNNSLLILEKNHSINIDTKMNILIITNDLNIFKSNKFKNILYLDNFKDIFNKFINFLFYHEDSPDFKDEFRIINNSFISKFAEVDKTALIGNNTIIGRGCKIGKNTIIKNNSVIKNCIIGNNVNIGDNNSIGSTGFGFDLKLMGASNLTPHLGIVYIDDNVRIGSNCTIDRAKVDVTYIGKNSMIDNLVHIAHNVILGNNACIAAQSGIAGSVVIGKNLISGGQSGYAGHIKIGDNVIVAAKSGVTKNIPNNSKVAGFPAIDIKEWKNKIIMEKKNGHK